MVILLVIIYVAFISLGLPDAVLGSAWPVISQSLNASLDFAGVMSIVMTLGTVSSSLYSTRAIQRFGTGQVVAFSVLMTALALLGFAFAYHIASLILLSIVLGLGAGAIDAALNNFVALHYQSKHMNYLHCFWGIGATAGPLIMAAHLTATDGWRWGYATLASIQILLVIALFITLPLWKKVSRLSAEPGQQQTTDVTERNETTQSTAELLSNREALKIRGVKTQLVLFCCYCSLELATGLWAATYLTIAKGVSVADAAFWTAVYYLGITGGRWLCGMLSSKISAQQLIRIGMATLLLGIVLLLLPMPILINQLALVLIGLGCAPIYPNTIHLTPKRFGAVASQAVIGLSMATAYSGMTVIAPLIGLAMTKIDFAFYPALLLVIGLLMVAMELRLTALTRTSQPTPKQQTI